MSLPYAYETSWLLRPEQHAVLIRPDTRPRRVCTILLLAASNSPLGFIPKVLSGCSITSSRERRAWRPGIPFADGKIGYSVLAVVSTRGQISCTLRSCTRLSALRVTWVADPRSYLLEAREVRHPIPQEA